MSNIFIKIEKDANTVKYIKLIRDYDKTISIGDIKRKIDSGDYESDLIHLVILYMMKV